MTINNNSLAELPTSDGGNEFLLASKKEEHIEFDDILVRYVGGFGHGQRLIFFILSLSLVFAAFQSLSPVFGAATPVFWCQYPAINSTNCTDENLKQIFIPQKSDGTIDSCRIYPINHTTSYQVDSICDYSTSHESKIKCDEYHYDSVYYKETMVTEWNLVCDQSGWASTINAGFMFGRVVGCIVFGPLIDKFGRRTLIIGLTSVNIVLGVLLSFSPGYIWVISGRFLLGMVITPRGTAALVEGFEVIGPKWRAAAGAIGGIFWALGYVIFAVIAYIFDHWRHLQLALSLPEILLLIAFVIVIPESPRWLLVKGRDKEATDVLRRIAKRNKNTFPDGIFKAVAKVEHEAKVSALDLVKRPSLLFATLSLCFIWSANAFVYYGLSLNTSNLGGNPFVNCFISGAVEIPACVSFGFLMNRFGRVSMVAVYMVIGGMALLAVVFVPADFIWLSITFAMLGKFFISASFMMVWVYTPEIYPTSYRSIGVSTCSMCARVASVLTSYVYMLDKIYTGLPLLLFGVMALAAAGLMCLLPETKGKAMPQTLHESEELIKQRRTCMTSCRHKSKDFKSPNAELALT